MPIYVQILQCVHIEPRSKEVSFNMKGILAVEDTTERKYLRKEENLWAC